MASPPNGNYQKIYAAVKRIPKGRVATYGQIALLAGLGRHARQVGYALHALPDGSKTPWHRVINAKGEISARSSGDHDSLQRVLLEKEGVGFGLNGRVLLEKYRWRPETI
jgi:methylated-DNA-protein-cysteine methyltransferase related protein